VFWWRNLRERGNLEEAGVGGRVILKWNNKKRWDGGMDWMYLVQKRDRWRAVVNAMMNLWVP